MTIIGLVSAGLGVSILPASFARVRVDGVRYLPLAEPTPPPKCGWCITAGGR